ncbi:nuclear transport factor 2 family protein [Acidisarcina polymorpha]|uniref:nuclear transport factor 2 family protein n=1 Tax=Acidisarcina polymorpha TaxID=2211140 RepID=UPI000DEFCC73|nr:nuclear transport factor 2 family protein [Acidisarcina polymorpha]
MGIGGAASLRIDCEDRQGVYYSDFMNLLKIDGVWKVVGKVFEAQEGASTRLS